VCNAIYRFHSIVRLVHGVFVNYINFFVAAAITLLGSPSFLMILHFLGSTSQTFRCAISISRLNLMFKTISSQTTFSNFAPCKAAQLICDCLRRNHEAYYTTCICILNTFFFAPEFSVSARHRNTNFLSILGCVLRQQASIPFFIKTKSGLFHLFFLKGINTTNALTNQFIIRHVFLI
jgi:hypothetical protein